MAAPGKAEYPHAGTGRRLDAKRRILDDQAVHGIGTHFPGGHKKKVGGGFGMSNHVGTEYRTLEETEESRGLEVGADFFRNPRRRDAPSDVRFFQKRNNAGKRLQILGEGNDVPLPKGRQEIFRQAGAITGEFLQHLIEAVAREPPTTLLGGDFHPVVVQMGGQAFGRDHLAVDENPVAVEDQQVRRTSVQQPNLLKVRSTPET